MGLDEAAYTRVSYDYPMAAARTLAEASPGLTYVSVPAPTPRSGTG
ncbi:hypothetical protein NCC78_06995 [Micromonospora phytophila]|nr:hypothetical protein [Micromonospora phytophila]MCM0674434.1 hypothetical protein [Micromonospora phytophila]